MYVVSLYTLIGIRLEWELRSFSITASSALRLVSCGEAAFSRLQGCRLLA
jgi:hypothetical protein